MAVLTRRGQCHSLCVSMPSNRIPQTENGIALNGVDSRWHAYLSWLSWQGEDNVILYVCLCRATEFHKQRMALPSTASIAGCMLTYHGCLDEKRTMSFSMCVCAEQQNSTNREWHCPHSSGRVSRAGFHKQRRGDYWLVNLIVGNVILRIRLF